MLNPAGWTSLYPGMMVLPARVVLHERLLRLPWGGIAAALAAVMLIAAALAAVMLIAAG